jgi:hypothetical protein
MRGFNHDDWRSAFVENNGRDPRRLNCLLVSRPHPLPRNSPRTNGRRHYVEIALRVVVSLKQRP